MLFLLLKCSGPSSSVHRNTKNRASETMLCFSIHLLRWRPTIRPAITRSNTLLPGSLLFLFMTSLSTFQWSWCDRHCNLSVLYQTGQLHQQTAMSTSGNDSVAARYAVAAICVLFSDVKIVISLMFLKFSVNRSYGHMFDVTNFLLTFFWLNYV
jgi:hypothetical protein